MDDKTKDNNLDAEIAKRLDDLFGEGDVAPDDDRPIEAEKTGSAENKPQEQQEGASDTEILDLKGGRMGRAEKEAGPDDYPLAELKNLVLSIDWEITEETLSGFLSEINRLKNTYKTEKIILMFLQLLGSLAQYIKTNRGKAHPKTFKTLNSVFSRLEEVILSENMPETEKKNLLQAEMQKYKQLRAQVSKKKAAAAGRKEAKSAPKAEPRAKALANQAAEVRDQKVAAKADAGNLPADAGVPLTPDTLAGAVKELKQFIHSELNVLRQELKKLQKSK